jgi:hypothetical protein
LGCLLMPNFFFFFFTHQKHQPPPPKSVHKSLHTFKSDIGFRCSKFLLLVVVGPRLLSPHKQVRKKGCEDLKWSWTTVNLFCLGEWNALENNPKCPYRTRGLNIHNLYGLHRVRLLCFIQLCVINPSYMYCIVSKRKSKLNKNVLDIDDQSTMYVVASKCALVAYLNQNINLSIWCT